MFIDEVDGLLCSTTNNEQGFERKLVNSFKTQLGRLELSGSHVMVVGATNFPWRIARSSGLSRRFGKKLHVGVPNWNGRRQLLTTILKRLKICHTLTNEDFEDLSDCAARLTGADITLALRRLQKERIKALKDWVYFKPVRNTMTSSEHLTHTLAGSDWWQTKARAL
jgi:SpoVK/Ycf46/Vps4 family AAA+-type ATPase